TPEDVFLAPAEDAGSTTVVMRPAGCRVSSRSGVVRWVGIWVRSASIVSSKSPRLGSADESETDPGMGGKSPELRRTSIVAISSSGMTLYASTPVGSSETTGGAGGNECGSASAANTGVGGAGGGGTGAP